MQVKNPCFQSHVCSYRADTKGQAACLHLAAHIFYLEAPLKLESTQYSHRILLNTDFITVLGEVEDTHLGKPHHVDAEAEYIE